MPALQRIISIYESFSEILKDELEWSDERIALKLSEIEQSILEKEDSKMTLSELESMISKCKFCQRKGLIDETKSSLHGRGNPSDIDILFIGLMPGETELETGKVFSGPNAEILRKAMLEAKVGTKECPVYIHNLVCCKPKGDKPKKEQINNCSPYLAELMYILNPNLIVTLGVEALSFMLGRTVKISDFEGEVLIQGGYIIVPLRHPSSIHRIPDEDKRNSMSIRYKNQIDGIKRVNDRIKKLKASGQIPDLEQLSIKEN